MIVYERLAYLKKMIEESKKLPLSEKVALDKVEALEIIKEIKTALPDELKQAQWISNERKQIIVKAHKESETIVNEAKEKVNEHELTLMAKEHAKKIIEAAKEEASQIKAGSRKYAEQLLEDVQNKLEEVSKVLDDSKNQLKSE